MRRILRTAGASARYGASAVRAFLNRRGRP